MNRNHSAPIDFLRFMQELDDLDETADEQSSSFPSISKSKHPFSVKIHRSESKRNALQPDEESFVGKFRISSLDIINDGESMEL